MSVQWCKPFHSSLRLHWLILSHARILITVISFLAMAMLHHNWVSLESIESHVSIHKHSLPYSSMRFSIASSSLSHQQQFSSLGHSSFLPHAGEWLTLVPSTALDLHLSDWEFYPCFQYWLGIHIYGEEESCPVRHHLKDPICDHQVGCDDNNNRITRHNFICYLILLAAQAAALASRREVP